MGENWLFLGESGAAPPASAALHAAWQPLWLTVLAFSMLCGLIAVARPEWFRTLARQGGQWVDTGRFVQWLDVRFDVDRYALRYPRAFGLLVIIAAVVLAVSTLKR
jgi:hypothetical protein